MPEVAPRRGELYLVNFLQAGGQLAKARPALIVQNDIANRYATHTIVVAIRHAQGKPDLPIFVRLPKEVSGLTKDSLVDCGHLVTLSKERLGKRLGTLPPSSMSQVDLALKRSLDLP